MKKKRPSTDRLSKLQKNLQFILEQHITGRHFRPSSTEELLLRLAVLPEQSELFEEVLEFMQEQGALQKNSEGAWVSQAKEAPQYYEGVIGFHPRGFAFVRLDEESQKIAASKYTPFNGDVFIPPSQTLNALPSDHVSVEIIGQDARGPDGRVVHILKRGKNSLYGIMIEDGTNGKAGYLSALVPALSQHKIVVEADPAISVKSGDRVILKVLDWEKKEDDIRCTIVEKLGHIDDASCDTDIAIGEYGLTREFPAAVLDEALTFGKTVQESEVANRRDLRQSICLTIDPDTAKDYDDAISVEKIGDFYHLGVHIADVAHYVPLNSALDIHARLRSNSTYFPGYCLPMLPSELSNELCSLKPDVDRLTVSVLMRFDSEAVLQDYEICRTVIKSAKRLTYRDALAIIHNERESPYKEKVDLMVELCQKLKVQKALRGSVEFSLPDAVVLCDEHGMPKGIDYVEYDITHQMIEEFMVKANELVATHLGKNKKELIYRIHEAPALDDLRDFFTLARYFGHPFHGMPTPQEWQQFFTTIKEAPYASQLATAYIRSMRLAQYSINHIGHFGLGLEYYCHFTSPIRRYSDLTIIRALFNEPREKGESLEIVAQQCSDSERLSAKAEQSVLLLKKLRYLNLRQEKEPEYRQKAMVVKIKPFGVSFDIQGLLMEGFIHVSELSDDFFIYDEARQCLRGRRTGLTLRSGTVIEVMLTQANLIYRECTWKLHPTFVEEALVERNRKKEEKRLQLAQNPDGSLPEGTSLDEKDEGLFSIDRNDREGDRPYDSTRSRSSSRHKKPHGGDLDSRRPNSRSGRSSSSHSDRHSPSPSNEKLSNEKLQNEKLQSEPFDDERGQRAYSDDVGAPSSRSKSDQEPKTSRSRTSSRHGKKDRQEANDSNQRNSSQPDSRQSSHQPRDSYSDLETEQPSNNQSDYRQQFQEPSTHRGTDRENSRGSSNRSSSNRSSSDNFSSDYSSSGHSSSSHSSSGHSSPVRTLHEGGSRNQHSEPLREPSFRESDSSSYYQSDRFAAPAKRRGPIADAYPDHEGVRRDNSWNDYPTIPLKRRGPAADSYSVGEHSPRDFSTREPARVTGYGAHQEERREAPRSPRESSHSNRDSERGTSSRESSSRESSSRRGSSTGNSSRGPSARESLSRENGSREHVSRETSSRESQPRDNAPRESSNRDSTAGSGHSGPARNNRKRGHSNRGRSN